MNEILWQLAKKYWPIHPDSLLMNKPSTDYILSPQNLHGGRELILFGGSFAPLHQGHLQAIKSLQKQTPEAQIVICPDWNPMKSDRADLGKAEERYKQLKIDFFQHFPHVPIYPGLLAMEVTTPSAHWIPQIPYSPKGLLLGADSFYSLFSWIDSPKLLSSIDLIYVLPRMDDMETFEGMKSRLHQLYPHLKIIRLPSHPFEKISSSELREKKGPL